jgi:hypothetical protein
MKLKPCSVWRAAASGVLRSPGRQYSPSCWSGSDRPSNESNPWWVRPVPSKCLQMNHEEPPVHTPHSAVSPGTSSRSESSERRKNLRSAELRFPPGHTRSKVARNSSSSNHDLWSSPSAGDPGRRSSSAPGKRGLAAPRSHRFPGSPSSRRYRWSAGPSRYRGPSSRPMPRAWISMGPCPSRAHVGCFA